MAGFFDLKAARPDAPEYIEVLLKGPDGLHLERIISHGHTTPPGQWYEQENDEWALVLKGSARIAFADGTEKTLNAGDSLLLPKGLRHRVSYSTSPCLWLALHAKGLELP
ncbi:cupin domain-containing protein [Desulfovibrio sp. OttesenSCG-928-M14]|nr:cupin domain-containing protein [Desulfovibrio sp. OttesenSCG-928-M14]